MIGVLLQALLVESLTLGKGFNFYKMKKHIPNTLTCLNLFSGCIAVLFALKGEFTFAFYAVVFSGICDFFDGMAARALHVKSLIGKELDSLADMVSFGFLPGAVIYVMLQQATTNPYIPYLGFLITVCSALRLAKFNIDERQTSDFIGLNTPMNTFFIISLPFIAEDYPSLFQQPLLLIGIAVATSLLLVSEIKLFSMKLTNLSWAANKYKYSFLLLSVVLIVWLQFLSLPIVLLLYILSSWLHFAEAKKAL